MEYNYVTLRCHLSDADRRSTGQYIQMVEAQGVDYFENLCLKGENRHNSLEYSRSHPDVDSLFSDKSARATADFRL